VFSEVVRTHRQRLGVTQEELASLAGVSVRSIREIEAGRISRPRPGTVRLLAEAFTLAGPDEPAPRQLPAAVPGFAGREPHLRQLDALAFDPDTGDAPATALVITAIDGMAGVGKTALAVHWAHRVADRFPDGQLYVNLRGFDPTGTVVSAAEAIRGFLDAFQIPAQRIPVGLDAQAALYRSLLAGRRMLIVLDNARDAEHVRPLLPGTPGCLVVVTSRNQLTGLVAAEGAHPLALDVLDRAGARELLTRRLGARRVAAEPEAVNEIIDRCARLPLTLALAAARAAARPQVPLTALAEQLRTTTGGGLAAFAVDDPATDVRAVFSWSYRTLTPEGARLFRVLGLHPGPDISAPAAASLAGIPVDRVDALLAELTRAHVLAEHAPGRYTFHDLLRAYATDRAHAAPAAARRHPGTGRRCRRGVRLVHRGASGADGGRAPVRRRRVRRAHLAARVEHGGLPRPARALVRLGGAADRRARRRAAGG